MISLALQSLRRRLTGRNLTTGSSRLLSMEHSDRLVGTSSNLKYIEDLLQPIVGSLTGSPKEFNLKVERCGNAAKQKQSASDYQTSIALSLAKELKRKPQEVGQAILARLPQGPEGGIGSAEVSGPGFVNISFDSMWI